MYKMETERVTQEIRRRGAKRVLVQLPDGLRPAALTLAETLKETTGAEIILSGDSCYGACDLSLNQADAIGADLIIHYGHSPMMKTEIPVVYVEAHIDFPVKPLVDELLPHIEGWSTVGLTATVQHAHKLAEVAEALESTGRRCLTGKGRGSTPHDGQILGCDYASAATIADDIDGYVYIGAGRFHPLGLGISTGKPIAMANPYLMTADRLNDKDVMRLAMKRMAAITAAKEASRYGVIVSLKPGQYRLEAARALVSRLEKMGKRATVICLDEAGTISLGNFTEAEAFIDTACPRIAVDGVADISKPILTTVETQVMLGDRKWEDVWGSSYLD
ncbi:MAG: diphthamide biosynthesis enzyme Dph2 [Candidatus Bathyarchaeota archaeon]|nr:MAG: diphthamide biosynthesis enzyme Dph2 [Candidatus Bathyarchaeota archaeon]